MIVTDVEIIKPILDRTLEYLETDYGIKFCSQTQYNTLHLKKTSVAIDIFGSIDGTYILSFSDRFATHIINNFFDKNHITNNTQQIIVEIIAEILNIVVGNAVYDINGIGDIKITPPITITKNITQKIKNQKSISYELNTKYGKISLSYLNIKLSSIL